MEHGKLLKSAFTFICYQITYIYSPTLYWPIKYQFNNLPGISVNGQVI